jgi:hypothetical protein
LNWKLKIKNWKIYLFFWKKWNFRNFKPILLLIFFLNFGHLFSKNHILVSVLTTPVFDTTCLTPGIFRRWSYFWSSWYFKRYSKMDFASGSLVVGPFVRDFFFWLFDYFIFPSCLNSDVNACTSHCNVYFVIRMYIAMHKYKSEF